MHRHSLTPRPDWRDRARMLGFAYAEIAGEPYWDETACWEFTAAEVDLLDDATAELERLARAAAEQAIRQNRRAMLGIPEAVWPLLVKSWGAAGAKPLRPHGSALGRDRATETARVQRRYPDLAV